MTGISAASESARENARTSSGKFGEQQHSSPELELDDAAFTASTPLMTTVILEQWQGDNAVEIGRAEFDARGIFDSRNLDVAGAPFPFDLDWVFESAQDAGLVSHNGPFTVEEPENLGEYIEYRKANGQQDALREHVTASPEDAARAFREAQGELILAENRAQLARETLIRSKVAELVPQARHVTRLGKYGPQFFDASWEPLEVDEAVAEEIVTWTETRLGRNWLGTTL